MAKQAHLATDVGGAIAKDGRKGWSGFWSDLAVVGIGILSGTVAHVGVAALLTKTRLGAKLGNAQAPVVGSFALLTAPLFGMLHPAVGMGVGVGLGVTALSIPVEAALLKVAPPAAAPSTMVKGWGALFNAGDAGLYGLGAGAMPGQALVERPGLALVQATVENQSQLAGPGPRLSALAGTSAI